VSEPVGTVLVVDDNEMNRDVLSRRLKREGFAVVAVDGGQAAIDRLGAEPFDIILLDVMMPHVSGLDVLRWVRARRGLAEAPVIMVTAKDQSEDVVEALGLGANDYVVKPIDFPVLMARVRTHLNLKRLSELKDEFLRIASHDLKNPLTEIMGTAGLVESLVPPGKPMPERLHGLVSRQKAAAKRMQGIIEDFLDQQAAEYGALQLSLAPVDLAELAAEAVESCQVAAQAKGITVKAEPAPGVAPVMADRARLAQVVQNFVDNAVKFGRSGDTVVARTRLDGDKLLLEVSDTGPGLQEADFAKVFSKYGRLSNRPTGGEKSTGLGLSIAKQLVEQHRGEIGVRNNEGPGATFWFSLPTQAPSS
jgi:two-component system sensor histidine kinase/response regulator